MATPWLKYSNQGATRSRPLSSDLVNKLGFLGDLGVTMDVFSGGQDAHGPNRTGSHRHDHGNAADVFLMKDGRRLDWNNPADRPVFEEVVKRGKAAGITGFGAGQGYMQPGSMHIGMGKPAVWGAGGSGDKAAGWLQNAFYSGGAPKTGGGGSGGMNNDLQRLIVETANAIGANPIDLATAISYETGGTFDPLKTGPTTKHGQHRGLIQFGEPQAQQYGVDWNNPLGSQLGANGAIAKYMRASGFKPGMSGMDLYSTINAGAPGKYGASDAAAGGAPGDVQSKWENQMGAHRAKAQALLGGGMRHVGGAGSGSGNFTPVQGGPFFGSMNAYGGSGGGGGIDPIAAQLAAGQAEKKKGSVLGNIGAALDASIPSAPSPGGGGGGFGNAGGILATIMQNPQALAQALMKRRMV